MTALVYDGDCAFCTASVRWVSRLHLRVDELVAWQHADLERLGLTAVQCEQALQWVGDDGRVASGHAAVAGLLRVSGAPWSWIGRLLVAPGLCVVAARAYRWVADHRSSLPGGTPACALAPADRPRP